MAKITEGNPNNPWVFPEFQELWKLHVSPSHFLSTIRRLLPDQLRCPWVSALNDCLSLLVPPKVFCT